ncbi:RodZ domain-containing protein [Psychromonas sp.]|uniref:RodZ domain-containing protein n=1 Tax=Psychromonas sp. TaxID=1884585 RepID=UPI0039E3FF89
MNNDTTKIISPLGLALHNARLKASLSVEQVAKLLNLNESAVKELEDDVSALIESGKYVPIYLRGYLANYAKVVALKSLDEFVEYQQLSKNQACHASIRATASMAPAAKKRLIPLWLLVLLLLIAILATVLVKQSGFFAAAESAAPAESSKGVENKPFNPIDQNEQNDQTLPELEQSTELEAVEQISPEAVIESAVDESSSADEIISADTSVAVEKNEPIAEPPTAVAESLDLSFSADCWTVIFDATGKRLAFGLYKNNDTLSLEGIAPFKMKLGAPSAVDIKYQDKIIERAFTAGQALEFYIPA